MDDLTHRRREGDVDPDPHDPATCPTCSRRILDERELLYGYGLRVCGACGAPFSPRGAERVCQLHERETAGVL